MLRLRNRRTRASRSLGLRPLARPLTNHGLPDVEDLRRRQALPKRLKSLNVQTTFLSRVTRKVAGCPGRRGSLPTMTLPLGST